jgi:hypothetical protein
MTHSLTRESFGAPPRLLGEVQPKASRQWLGEVQPKAS